MSAEVKCDGCGVGGRRRMRAVAPAGWFYLEIQEDDEDTEDDAMIAYACSEECRDTMWKRGPGRLDLSPPKRSTPNG